MGAQFKEYLINFSDDKRPEGEMPGRFLKSSIFQEIDSLMEIYRTLFGHLKIHKPGVNIIVHGYDYPVRLDDADKGWLGRYMIAKGISRRGDRQAVIRHIMDYFNEKLALATQGFNNVSYIDLRGLVQFDTNTGVNQWYDEIHPNNDGFQQIAMKYIQKIDSLTKVDA